MAALYETAVAAAKGTRGRAVSAHQPALSCGVNHRCAVQSGVGIPTAVPCQDDRLVKEQGMIIAELEGQFSQMKAALAELTERERLVGESWEKVRARWLMACWRTRQSSWYRIPLQLNGAPSKLFCGQRAQPIVSCPGRT